MELEPVSGEQPEAASEQPSDDGGCCGGTDQKEPAPVTSHA